MREAFLIAKREYLEHVRSRAFLFSTFLIPVLFAVIFGLSVMSAMLGGGGSHIVVASNDAMLAEGVKAELTGTREPQSSDGRNRRPSAQMQVEVLAPISESDLGDLNRQVESKAIDGFLWLDMPAGESQPTATYRSRGSTDFVGNDRLQQAIGHALVRRGLIKQGVTPAAIEELQKGVELKSTQIKNGRVTATDAGKSVAGAYFMAFLLYFAVVFYGMNVARSVVAEKTSRVFEVLLATAKPESLMAGKLLGVGAVGLTQMGIWIGALLLLSVSAAASQLGQGGLAAYGISPIKLVFFVIYFLLGYFFYSALSAGFGASVSQESEVQQFAMLLVMPQLVGLMLTVYILANPTSWPVVLLSLFPPCTPIVMCLRMSAMAVPAWQLGLSLVLMAGSIWVLLWIASRIYSVGILMYGKRATLPEMLRWLRYS